MDISLSELQEIIKKYYIDDLINLNNKNNFKSYEWNKKIKNSRKSIGKYFEIKNLENIIFFPNNFYIQETILNSLNLDKNWTIYFDADELYLKKSIFTSKCSLKNFNKFKENDFENGNILFWLKNIENLNLITKNCKKNNEKIFLIIENILDIKKVNLINNIDFLLFNPSKIWNLYGISIFLIFKNSFLKPLYLGSNSINFLNKENFSLKTDNEIFECGTQNFILFVILDKFFRFLNKQK